MNIKTFLNKTTVIAGLFFAVLAVTIIVPTAANAATPKDLCKNKVRPDACEEAVKNVEKCNDLSGDAKDKCRAERAGDFKDKEPVLFSPAAAQDDRKFKCGNSESGTQVKTRIDFGCLGDDGPDNMGPIEDLAYALVRFLSAGVGIVVIFFIILAGIQYSTSEGNAEKTQDAKNKVRDAIIGLIVYLFAFALVQYLVPGGVFSTIVNPDTTLTIIRGIL